MKIVAIQHDDLFDLLSSFDEHVVGGSANPETLHHLFEHMRYDGKAYDPRHWVIEDVMMNTEFRGFEVITEILSKVFKGVQTPFIVVGTQLMGDESGSVLFEVEPSVRINL